MPRLAPELASRPPAQAMSGRQSMLAAVRRALASAAPLDPSSAPRLAPRALGELVRPGALFPHGVVVVARRTASGGRAGVAAASYKAVRDGASGWDEIMRFASRHLAVISGGDGAADAGARAGAGEDGLHLRALRPRRRARRRGGHSGPARRPPAGGRGADRLELVRHAARGLRAARSRSPRTHSRAVGGRTPPPEAPPRGQRLPNGAAFNAEGMISLALLDELVRVDRDAMTVTTQAGARVLELVGSARTG